MYNRSAYSTPSSRGAYSEPAGNVPNYSAAGSGPNYSAAGSVPNYSAAGNGPNYSAAYTKAYSDSGMSVDPPNFNDPSTGGKNVPSYKNTDSSSEHQNKKLTKAERWKKHRKVYGFLIGCCGWVISLTAVVIFLIIDGFASGAWSCSRLADEMQTHADSLERLKAQDEQHVKVIAGFNNSIEHNEKQLQEIDVHMEKLSELEEKNEDILKKMNKFDDMIDKLTKDLQRRITENGNKITKNKEILQSPGAVMFTATNERLTLITPNNVRTDLTYNLPILVFPQLQVNVGNGYDLSSGKFTAPLEGYYQFDVGVQEQNTTSINVVLYLNGARELTKSQVKLDRAASWSCLVHLRVDDFVFVSPTGAKDSFPSYAMFSGHLLHLGPSEANVINRR